MEKLVPIVFGILVLGLLAFVGGGWILHEAINAGDFYEGVVGIGAVAGGLMVAVAAAVGLS